MRLHAIDTLALLSESRSVQRNINASIAKAIGPVAEKRDTAVQTVLRSGFNLRVQVLNMARMFERDLKEKLFSVAKESEAALRSMYERRNVRFESDAIEFFKSAAAESVNRFSEYLSYNLTKEIDKRSLEKRARGSYAAGESSYYGKRAGGETKRKQVASKQDAIAYSAERALKAGIERALKQAVTERQAFVDAAPWIIPQAGPSFAIANKTQKELRQIKTRHILLTKENEGVDFYSDDD